MAFAASERVAELLRRSGIGVHPREWRMPPIETYPRVVAFVQTLPGKLLLVLLFAVVMRVMTGWWLEMTLAAAIVSLAGRHRPLVALA